MKPIDSIYRPVPGRSNEDCAICREALNKGDKVSGHDEHQFHPKCLEEALKVKRACPLCRFSFEDPNSGGSTSLSPLEPVNRIHRGPLVSRQIDLSDFRPRAVVQMGRVVSGQAALLEVFRNGISQIVRSQEQPFSPSASFDWERPFSLPESDAESDLSPLYIAHRVELERGQLTRSLSHKSFFRISF